MRIEPGRGGEPSWCLREDRLWSWAQLWKPGNVPQQGDLATQQVWKKLKSTFGNSFKFLQSETLNPLTTTILSKSIQFCQFRFKILNIWNQLSHKSSPSLQVKSGFQGEPALQPRQPRRAAKLLPPRFWMAANFLSIESWQWGGIRIMAAKLPPGFWIMGRPGFLSESNGVKMASRLRWSWGEEIAKVKTGFTLVFWENPSRQVYPIKRCE